MSALAMVQPDEALRPTTPGAGVYAALGLRDDPFPSDPLAGAWTTLPSRQPAMTAIAEFLGSDTPGLAIVGGAAGTGLTRTMHRIANDQTGRRVAVVADEGGRRSDAQLLRAIIAALGAKPVSRTGLELAAEIRGLLEANRDERRMPVIFIDHAALTGSQLEIVRSLLGTAEAETRVQIVALGPPELADRVARRRSLARFLRESVAIAPLDLAETRSLLEARIAAVRETGNEREPLIPDDASARMWEITGGAPGAIVSLAHRCLREAVASGARQVTAEMVTRVAASPEDVAAAEAPIQTRLTLPGLDETAAPARRRGRQR